MKLKRIKLNNIRSYDEEEIEFPEGSTLLSGDIGSGKTSILLGIEFGLFGLQPGQKGASILKNGEKEGGVEVDFEIDEKDIQIERTLKRNKTVSQDYCAITINGEKTETSVTELKNKVLEILQYPPEFSKKQNLLYKFTVYTPQEEMKQIILQDPESRINTLRHIFGIDKYKKIIENASIVMSKIRSEKRIKEALISNIEAEKKEINEKENQLEDKNSEIKKVEIELGEKKQKTKEIEIEKQGIEKKIEEKNKTQQEIEKTNLMISNKKDYLFENSKKKQQLENQIKELNEIEFSEEKINILKKEIEKIKKEKENLSKENLEISTKINSLNLKNNENEKIKEKLKHIEVCPTCLQNVNWDYKNNVLKKMNSNIQENSKMIEKMIEEKKDIEKNIEEKNKTQQEIENEIQKLQILKLKIQSLEEKKNSLSELEKHDKSLEKDIEMLKNQLNTLKASLLDLKKYESFFDTIKQKFEEKSKEERKTEIKLAELKKEVSVFKNQIEELKEKYKKREEIKKEHNHLSDLEDWISKKFIPAISNIENNVMTKLRREFSKLFSEWFAMLVPETFNIRIDEKFTPIIEQKDYEIEYQYLSGGERTAIALAYRLSLNQVLNSLLSKIKTKDFVILDEPTDGFSEAQLDKMRNILEELNIGQLIIVSHEQKMESFVDNAIKFNKINGISRKE